MKNEDAQTARILIVDDDRPIQRLFNEILTEKGYRCAVASDAPQARELMAAQGFDLLISDINMPGESGLDFSRFVMSEYPDTAILISTGLIDTSTASLALEIGVFDYITKPFKPERVLISVASALQRRRLERENRDHRERLEHLVDKRTEALMASVRELENAKAKLQESEARYREIVQESGSFMMKLDTAGRILSFNEFAQSFFGYREEEIVNQPIVGTILPHTDETGRDLERMIENIVSDPDNYRSNHNQNVKRNGEPVWISWSNRAVLDENGRVQAVLCVGNDITERKRIQDELRESEEKFRTIATSAQDAIIMMNHQGRISYWNAAAEKMFGYPEQEALARDLHTLIAPEGHREAFQKNFARFQETGQGPVVDHMFEVNAVGRDGTEFPVELSLSAMHLKGKWHALGIIRDVSERRVMEAQLVQAQKLESIGQLAAGIAHEINTPTQYVSYNTRFLRDQFKELDSLFDHYQQLYEQLQAGAEVDDVMAKIDAVSGKMDVAFVREEIPSAIEQSLEGLERVSEIVRAMKDFSHPGSQEKVPINLNQAIQSTVTVARNEWKYVAELKTRFDPDLPPVPCLPGDFNQVILNIIINAAHAIGDIIEEGTDNKGTITITTGRNDGWAQIRIKDTGAGISAENRDRIFDPFFTTKGVGRGTGQGLAISHSVIVGKHGGSLDCKSEPGKGTTFIIQIPIDAESE